MNNKEYKKTNLENEYAIKSILFPFVNAFMASVIMFVLAVFLAITDTNIEKIFTGLIWWFSCYTLILNIRYAVSFGLKSEKMKILAIIGIVISVFSIFINLMISLMIMIDEKIGLRVKIGVPAVIATLISIWIYNGIIRKIFKGTRKEIKAIEDKLAERDRILRIPENGYKYYTGNEFINKKAIEKELKNFDELKELFNEFRMAYEEKDGKRDCILNLRVDPAINGIYLLSAKYYFNANKKGLSVDEYTIQALKMDYDGQKKTYIYETKDINELIRIYQQFIENQKTLDFSKCLTKYSNNYSTN